MPNDEHSSLANKFGKYQVDEMVEVLNNYKGQMIRSINRITVPFSAGL